MKAKFIYVFSAEDKERMLSQGYELVRAEPNGKFYVFANKDDVHFENENMKFSYSNMLSF